MYTEIHKGVRKALFDAALLLGVTDWAEDEAAESARAAWQELKDLLREHVENERVYAHPLYEAKMAGVARQLTADHEEQEALLAELETQFDRLMDLAKPEERVAMGLEFYRRLNLFIADYLPHLQREEGIYMRNLWDLYSQDELRDVLAAIINAESRYMLQLSSRLILQGANHQDLMSFMGAVAERLEPSVMERMMAYSQQYLPPHELEKLMKAMQAQMAGAPA
jgi:hypothetical protein